MISVYLAFRQIENSAHPLAQGDSDFRTSNADRIPKKKAKPTTDQSG